MNIKNIPLSRYLLIGGAAAIVLLIVVHAFEHDLPAIEQWISDRGAFAPLAFIAVFVVLSPLLFPVDILCFAAGVLFPLSGAFLYSAIALYTAAAIIFRLGRKVLHGKIRSLLAGWPQFLILDAIVAEKSFKLMLLLRLTPLPFALLSYAFSLTAVEFWPYLAATTGILAHEAVFVYLGYTTKHISGLLAEPQTAAALPTPVVLIGLAAAVAVLSFVAKTARRELQARMPKKPDQLKSEP